MQNHKHPRRDKVRVWHASSHFHPPWQCRKVKKVQVLVYVCAPLLGCAYEGGNREEARMVGLLHVHENSREWETGKPLGAIWGLLVFRVQGKGNSSPAKDTPWLVLKALT